MWSETPGCFAGGLVLRWGSEVKGLSPLSTFLTAKMPRCLGVLLQRALPSGAQSQVLCSQILEVLSACAQLVLHL